MVGDGPVDELGVGETDQDAAAVLRVEVALHPARVVEPVEPVGRRGRGQHERATEPGGGQHVRRTGPARRGEHVELPGPQAVHGEHSLDPGCDECGEPAEPADGRHRRQTVRGEVGALVPGGRPRPHRALRAAGRTTRDDGVVTDVPPGRRFARRTTSGVDADGSREVGPLPDGSCRVRLELRVRPPGLLRLVPGPLRWLLACGLRGDLDRLRALVGTGRATRPACERS